MLVWLDGALDPQQIRDRVVIDGDLEFGLRLCSFVDGIISNGIPYGNEQTQPTGTMPHPCSVRFPQKSNSESEVDYEKMRKNDIRRLVSVCQQHSHTSTCYKYWPGEPHPKECRFGLSELNKVERTTLDPETGEFEFKISDGLVNNFCESMLEAIRCNMDIQFIGSGASAKAVLYYITDYITKAQLKAHTAYVALQAAVSKLEAEVSENGEMDLERKARLMLIKCANSLIARQELSAPQVASYLMECGDKYTSHSFRSLYWTSFEAYVNANSDDDDDDNSQQLVEEDCETDDAPLNVDNNSLEDNVAGEQTIPEIDDEEFENESFDMVIVESKDNGQMRAKGNQVMDYIYRGSEFVHLNVWDFVAEIDKILLGDGAEGEDPPNKKKKGHRTKAKYQVDVFRGTSRNRNTFFTEKRR